jgi:hypothetical protein
MITFAAYGKGAEFLQKMKSIAEGAPPKPAAVTVIVTEAQTVTEFRDALLLPADLVIVSAHGSLYTIREPFQPGLTAASDGSSEWFEFSRLSAGAKIGARAGIVWDACNAGRPAFRKELAPLLAHQVASIGVIGRIDDPDSTSIATKILEELLSPGKPPVTAETVLAAGRAARAVTRLNLTSTLLGGREPS